MDQILKLIFSLTISHSHFNFSLILSPHTDPYQLFGPTSNRLASSGNAWGNYTIFLFGFTHTQSRTITRKGVESECLIQDSSLTRDIHLTV